jgi:signal transduction histidine kinase
MSERVLVLAPSPGDGELCRRLLHDAGVVNRICTSDAALCVAMEHPLAVLVVAEDALMRPVSACIRDYLAQQPDWSALPVIVLARQDAEHRLGALAEYNARGHVTLLERPVRPSTFIGTLRLALQQRREQYRLRDLLAERSESDRLRDDLLARLSHELRNPLAVVLMSAEALGMMPPDSEQAGYFRSAIGAQVKQMEQLLDDFSAMSCISQRKLALQSEPIDLRQVLRDVVNETAQQFESRRQRLEVELDGVEVPLFADPRRLRQVFANLLNNAIRYCAEGCRIRVKLETGDGWASVSIRDDGAGLSQEAFQHIFEPFCQKKAGDTPHGRIGIELALASSLVKMHAGNISAYSDGPGRGSEVIVRLPLYERDAVA